MQPARRELMQTLEGPLTFGRVACGVDVEAKLIDNAVCCASDVPSMYLVVVDGVAAMPFTCPLHVLRTDLNVDGDAFNCGRTREGLVEWCP